MQTRLLVVGGFLGAGKTTLLLNAAKRLAQRGLRVGLVTNDQGHNLVDTALADRQQIPVEEVAGGCFCCRFPDLLTALQRLAETVAPDVILAEPVGSCTDLMATVLRPLARFEAGMYRLAPLTVLLDATRQIEQFSSTVDYLFERQLAEAEVILLNKIDLVSSTQQEVILNRLHRHYPHAQLLASSAQTGIGLDTWLALVESNVSRLDRSLELDYQRYAAAEAELGWLNARGTIQATHFFSAQNWLKHLLLMVDGGLQSHSAAVAHIKAHITTAAATGTVTAKASLTQSGGAITWEGAPANSMTDVANFTLNARVHTSPRILEESVRFAMTEVTPPPDFIYSFTHFECFRPLPPQPTHRLL